ncbi:PaaX family transcriptional regulator [Massilia suwonensis]|uniref:PaaX family transcriptional regulator n=1 Tax=Massilia suwonensis TaxID=648895 RepID=A0ABW0MPV5_9BURK
MDTTCNIAHRPLRAPELILDLLIANGTALSSQVLCRAGAVMDLSETAVRVALNRLCEQGKLRQPARGVYAVSPASRPLFGDVDAWRRKGAGMVAWNGDWVAVHDSLVQRSDKTAWRHHCLALALRGFAQFEPSLHLRPDNLEGGIEALRANLPGLGLAPQATLFRLTGLDATRQAQARGLWNVDALERQYAALAGALEAHTARMRDKGVVDALRESLLLGREAIGLLVRDPLLPPELMALDARQILMAAAARYQDAARSLWRNWIQEIGGSGPTPAANPEIH